MALTTIGVLAT